MICTPYTSLEPGVRRLTFHDFSLISFGWGGAAAAGKSRPEFGPAGGQKAARKVKNFGQIPILRKGKIQGETRSRKVCEEFGLIRCEIQGGVWPRKARAQGEGTAMHIHRSQERRI